MAFDTSIKPPLFKCRACRKPTYLCDLNDNMHCEACGADDPEREPMSGLQDSIYRANQHRLRWEDR